MAITIEQQPRLFALSMQDLIYVLSSDNYTEDGFRIKVVVSSVQPTFTNELYIYLNSANRAVINIVEMTRELTIGVLAGNVHAQYSNSYLADDDGSQQAIEVQFTEYWLIDGVLTENAGSTVGVDPMTVNAGFFDNKYGYAPDIEGTDTNVAFTLNGNTKRLMSDRKFDTHIWSMAETFGITPSEQTIFIPVREADFGVMLFPFQNTLISNNAAKYITITLYDSAGAPHTFTEDVSILSGAYVMDAHIYPANLNASSLAGLPRPADYTGWRFYTVRMLNSSSVACSAAYVFYNSNLYGQKDCKFDVVRLGFANSRGGWDYQNFIKRNEESLSMDRKRYHKIRGNYDTGSTFTYGAYESGLTERTVIADKFMTINSDWLQENEFVFLQSLLVSNQVHWLHDDGTYTPVVIESNEYQVKRARNGKLVNLDLKLRFANPYKN